MSRPYFYLVLSQEDFTQPVFLCVGSWLYSSLISQEIENLQKNVKSYSHKIKHHDNQSGQWNY